MVGLVVLGVMLLLFGSSLVLVALLDRLVVNRVPFLTRWLDVR